MNCVKFLTKNKRTNKQQIIKLTHKSIADLNKKCVFIHHLVSFIECHSKPYVFWHFLRSVCACIAIRFHKTAFWILILQKMIVDVHFIAAALSRAFLNKFPKRIFKFEFHHICANHRTCNFRHTHLEFLIRTSQMDSPQELIAHEIGYALYVLVNWLATTVCLCWTNLLYRVIRSKSINNRYLFNSPKHPWTQFFVITTNIYPTFAHRVGRQIVCTIVWMW